MGVNIEDVCQYTGFNSLHGNTWKGDCIKLGKKAWKVFEARIGFGATVVRRQNWRYS